MSGIYNETYFSNHPEIATKDGVLYCVVLVNQKTFTRECIKIGIASGKNWQGVLKRSRGFKGYDIRIQRTYHDTLYNCWCLEQALHKQFAKYRYTPKQKFSGHTECFSIEAMEEIIPLIATKK